MMNMLGKILDKFTNFSPIKRFINYALDKTFNEFLSNELRLEDFKNGELNLTNIDWKVDKINKVYLASSPYILHSGSIGNLKIILPPLSEISTKSIEILIRNMQIELKPNKRFYQTFKEIMRLKQEEEPYFVSQPIPENQISENSPMDFFKQLLKQIFLNIRVKAEDSIVKLFMNEPSASKSKNKLQYYLLMRVPSIIAGPNEDSFQQDIDIDEIKFALEISQISVHLLKENTQYPEYKQQKMGMGEFPFVYPSIHHPSTVLVVGNTEVNGKNSTRLLFSLVTNFKAKQKNVLLSATIANLEIMVDPFQIKIISRLVVQVKEFKKIFKCVIEELGLNHKKGKDVGTMETSGMIRKASGGNVSDLFSSIVLSFGQMGPANSSQDFISKIAQTSELEESISEFNITCQKVYEENDKPPSKDAQESFRNVKFQQEFTLKFRMSFCSIYILKQTPKVPFSRKWMVDQKSTYPINVFINSSYFIAAMQKMTFQFTKSTELTNFTVQKMRVCNVKLYQQPKKQGEEFFESVQEQIIYGPDQAHKPNLLQFSPQINMHFCVDEIFLISRTPSKLIRTLLIKEYVFLPLFDRASKNEEAMFKYGFNLRYNGKSKELMINVEEVSVCVNAQIVKDIIEIMHPIVVLAKISESIIEVEQVKEQLQEKGSESSEQAAKPKERVHSLLESQYIYSAASESSFQELELKQLKLTFSISVELINFGLRQCLPLQHFENLHKLEQNVQTPCFCGQNSRSYYIEIFETQFIHKNLNSKLSAKKIEFGLLKIEQSEILKQHLRSFMRIEGLGDVKSYLRLFVEKKDANSGVKSKNKSNYVYLYVPKVSIKIRELQLLDSLQMLKRMCIRGKALLTYTNLLKSKMSVLENLLPSGKSAKKVSPKESQTIHVYIEELNLSALFLRFHFKGLFFFKSEQELILKLEQIIVASRENIKTKMGQYQNQTFVTVDYPEKCRFDKIHDSLIILELCQTANTVKVFESDLRYIFFSKLYQSKVESEVKIVKSNESNVSEGKKVYRKGRFKQLNPSKNVSEVIPQENTVKTIIVTIRSQINIVLVNALKMLEHKEYAQKLLSRLNILKDDLKADSEELVPLRKNSAESQVQQNIELDIKIANGRLNIDIRPQYELKKNSHRTYSNSRLILSLIWDRMRVNLASEQRKQQVSAQFSIQAHFLRYLDLNLELNPLIVHSRHYDTLGFKNILSLRAVWIELFVNSLKKNVQLKIICQEASVTMSVSTIQILKVHFDHLIKHHIEGNYGLSRQQLDDIYEDISVEKDKQAEAVEFQRHMRESMDIEDISDSFSLYSGRIQDKKQSQAEFRERDFVCFIGQPSFWLSNLTVKSMRVKLVLGEDFEFLENTRQRSEQGVEVLNYLCFFVQNLAARAEQREKLIDVQVQTEKIEMLLSKRKPQERFFSRFISKKCDEQVIFPLLKCGYPLRILVSLSPLGTRVKVNKIEISLGYTEEINRITEQMKISSNLMAQSGWKKIYQRPIKFQKASLNQKLFLLLLPQGKVYFTLQYFQKQFISNQYIALNEFCLHEEINNSLRIKSLVMDWIKDLLKNNLGNLVSGAAVSGLSQMISSLLGVVGYLLSVMLGEKR